VKILNIGGTSLRSQKKIRDEQIGIRFLQRPLKMAV